MRKCYNTVVWGKKFTQYFVICHFIENKTSIERKEKRKKSNIAFAVVCILFTLENNNSLIHAIERDIINFP